MKTKSITQISQIVFSILFLAFLLSSCKDDATENPPHLHDGELITTVRLVLTDTITGQSATFSTSDLDGPGGANPVIDTLSIQSGRVYAFTALVLDENSSPIDTISAEIFNEGVTHLFVYTSPELNVQISDQDINGFPLGLKGYISPLVSGPGALRVQLRHYTSASAKASSSSSYSTDVDFTMPVIVN
jgi:hypothetical protein